MRGKKLKGFHRAIGKILRSKESSISTSHQGTGKRGAEAKGIFSQGGCYGTQINGNREGGGRGMVLGTRGGIGRK